MIDRWERSVPVYNVPVRTRAFYILCFVGAVAVVFVTWRELAGLGPATGLNDAYAWGIWKTFNIMVLTALGSGGFSVGITAWLFKRQRGAVSVQYLAGLNLDSHNEIEIYQHMTAFGPHFSPNVFTGSDSLLSYLREAIEIGSSR